MSYLIARFEEMLVEAVRKSNDQRILHAKTAVGFTYFFIFFACALFDVSAGVVFTWMLRGLFPSNLPVTTATIVCSSVLMVVHGFVSWLGGLTGWLIISFLYIVTWAVFSAFACMSRKANEEKAEGNTTTTEQQPRGNVKDVGNAPNHFNFENDPEGRQHSPPEGEIPPGDVKSTWSARPDPISGSQMHWCLAFVVAMLLMIIIVVIIVLAYNVETYHLTDQSVNSCIDNVTCAALVEAAKVPEFIPKMTQWALVFMYAFPHLSTGLGFAPYVEILTDYCGKSFTKELKDNKTKKVSILQNWIEKYDINMTIYTPKNYWEYSTVNEWFTREIDLAYRPLPSGAVNPIVVAPADCRMLIFEAMNASRIWVKDTSVTPREITGGLLGNIFDEGPMVIARLAPQDYHRFHAPATGTIERIESLDGTLWSVSADAAQSKNKVFLNQRKVVILDTPDFGKIAYVAIGATCVGSVALQHRNTTELKVGDSVLIGEQLGYMQFGGSTIVLFFEPGRVQFDARLLKRSRSPVETLVEVRSLLGESTA